MNEKKNTLKLFISRTWCTKTFRLSICTPRIPLKLVKMFNNKFFFCIISLTNIVFFNAYKCFKQILFLGFVYLILYLVYINNFILITFYELQKYKILTYVSVYYAILDLYEKKIFN